MNKYMFKYPLNNTSLHIKQKATLKMLYYIPQQLIPLPVKNCTKKFSFFIFKKKKKFFIGINFFRQEQSENS